MARARAKAKRLQSREVSSGDRPFGQRHPTLLVLVLGMGGLLVYLQQSVVLPLVPILPSMVDASAADVSWVVTATLLVGATATPVAARLGDMYGKRRLLLACLACLVAGSILCAASTGLLLLLVGRAIQGGAIGVLPLAMAVLRDELPAERVAWGVGLISSTSALGIVVGPVLPGLIGDFHVTFWVLGGLGMAVLLLVRVCVAGRMSGARSSLDAVGAGLLMVMLSLLLLPLSKGNDWGWSSPSVLGMFAGCVATAVVWGRYEIRRREPFVDLRLNGSGPVLLTQLAGVASGFALFGNALVNTTILQAPTGSGYGLGLSLFGAGLSFIPGAVMMVLGAQVAGWLIRRRGSRATLVAGMLICATGYVVRIFVHGSVFAVVALFAVLYGGIALALAALAVLVMECVEPQVTGAALGVNTLARLIGQSTFASLFGAVTGWFVVTVRGEPVAAWSAIVVLSVATTVAALATVVIGLRIRAPRALLTTPTLVPEV